MISVPHSGDDVSVCVPPRLNAAHLASVLSRRLGRDTTISGCKATNLCAHNWGGVSNSGATVLRLSLTLDDGHTHDLVAKILSPDPVNLFKLVTLRYLLEQFQALRWVPYQTRSREFVHLFIGLCKNQLTECRAR